MVSTKTAAERHAAAKLELKRVEQKVDAATEHRRQVLREHDANSTAAIRADDVLDELKRLRLRLVHQIDLLPLVIQREQSELENPSTATACDERLSGMEDRLARLRAAQKSGPVSAGVDAEADRLVVRIGEMRKRRDYLRRFDAPDHSETAA